VAVSERQRYPSQPIRPFKAVKAFFDLVDDRDDTRYVFAFFNAVNGRSNEAYYERFLNSDYGKAFPAARACLARWRAFASATAPQETRRPPHADSRGAHL
jgi:hypothetical protein